MTESQKRRLVKLEKKKPQAMNLSDLELDESGLTEPEKARFSDLATLLGEHRISGKTDLSALPKVEQDELSVIFSKLIVRNKGTSEVVDIKTVKLQPFD